jgi:hypothetical protein
MLNRFIFSLTTGRKVLLSIAVPAMSAYLLSLIEIRTDIQRFPNGDMMSWRPKHLYDYTLPCIVFALLTFVFLWCLWADRKDDHAA